MSDELTSPPVRWVAGCMTGTSLDGIDAALVKIDGGGLGMKAHFVGMVSRPLGKLADTLRHFAEGRAAVPLEFMRAARALGELHADAVRQLCGQYLNAQPGSPPLDFVVAHGQTIWHAPPSCPVDEEDLQQGLSWQLFDPWPVVRLMRVPVCFDLRQADLIAGGQGAPITPLADWIMYRDAKAMRPAIINLGGIANGTLLDAQPQRIEGGDICACNILIDGLVRAAWPDLKFDEDGKFARAGRPHESLVRMMSDHAGFGKGEGRSLGREGYEPEWFAQLIAQARTALGIESGNDIVRSAVQSVAMAIGAWVRKHRVDQVILAGGGARNDFLVESIRAHCGLREDGVMNSDELGIPCEAREAMAFAVIGALSQDGVVITLPQVTGALNPGRAGAWVYP